jgi:hypothetical protein
VHVVTPRVLLDERVVAVQPSLVRALGMNCAVVAQQVHYHLRSGGVRAYDGHEWVRLPYADLCDETGMTEKRARTAVGKLEADGVLVSAQPEHWDRSKWYRIDYERLDRFDTIRPTAPTGGSKRPYGRQSTAPTGGSLSSDTEDLSRARTREDQTARAQRATQERQMRDAERIDQERPSPRSQEHIARARAALNGRRTEDTAAL